MASGKLTTKSTLNGSISTGNRLKSASVAGGSGTTDHSRLINKESPDQHPIEAITGLRKELDAKLDSKTALPLIDNALTGKAKGLYFDALKELSKKSYWYLTSEIDPKTGLGTKDSIISGPYDLGMGGGSGGGGGVTTISVKQVNWPSAVAVGASASSTYITVDWSSVIGEDRTPTGEGTLYLSVNGRQVETLPKQRQGQVRFEISSYLVSGDNTIQIKVLDMYGTTGLTVGTITGVALELKEAYSREKVEYGKIDFTYIPVGNVDKKVYFIIDDEDPSEAAFDIVKSSNQLQTHTFYGLTHGAHTLRVYFEADINGQKVPSNELFYDIIFVEEKNTTPIIASDFNNFTQEQYIGFNIPYRVFIYGKSLAPVMLKANGNIVRTFDAATYGTHNWAYRADEPTIKITDSNEIIRLAEPIVLEICCGTTTKRFEVDVVESKITVTPISNNLELMLSANGRSNDEFDHLRSKWTYTTTPPPGAIEESKTYECTFTGFNWSSDGWVPDKVDSEGKATTDSTTVLRVGGDARVEIPLEVFASNFTTQGKTIELEIATRDIRNYDTTIISCLDKIKTPFYTVEEFFAEEDTRLYGFEVSYIYSILAQEITTLGKHIFSYNGTSWTLNDNIVNLNDYGITLKGERRINVEGVDKGSVIKGDRIVVNYSLEARGFEVTPQVASIRSQQSFLSTQYKEDEHIRIAFVIEPNTSDKNRIIWMYINGVASGAMQYPADDTFKQEETSYITVGSSDATVDIYNIKIYNAALTNRQIVNNWIADTANAADKAYRFNHNNILTEKDELTPESLKIGAVDLPYMIWDIDPLPEFKGDKRYGNGRYVDHLDSTRNFTVEKGEYNVQGTSSSVYPTKNIRLRNRSKNGEGYAWYDDDGNTIENWPITHPGGIGDNYFTFKVDYASSEGANNVELTKLYNDASIKYGLLTPPQRQNAAVRVGIDGFPIAAFHKNAAGEISFHTKANFNNDKANEGVYGFEDGDESWETTNNSAAETKYQIPVTVDNFSRGFEIRFPDKDGYNDMSKLGPMTAWVYSTYRAEATNEELETPVTFKYEESVQSEGGSFSTTKVEKTFTHDTAEYRLAKFKAELADWFNVDSCLFYYLFTELFLMIDSRAKNAFPTYFKSRKEGDGGDRWFWIPYDMDTAIGIDNKGKLTFDYYLEDTDQLDGADVYNGQSSVMWCNIRDAFRGELAAMYAELRNQKLISYDEVEKRFEDHQHKWPEVLLNLDSHNKYIVPLKNGDNYLEMLQGTKEQQRKWWLYNRFKYIDSKYNGGEAVKDFVQFRAYVDIGEEKPDLVITPYANIYATASFGNGANYVVSERVLDRSESVTLKNPFGLNDDENDQETYIYSASQLKSIGDISPFHPDTVKIGNAIRLQDLKVGDASPNYKNPYLKELTVGANTLLRTLDARNCVNLGTGTTVSPDLRQCTNIEEIYFTGTKIKGIQLPDGGTLKTLYLPGTLKTLTLRNQPLLTDLYIESTNTTITRSVEKEDGNYSFRGVVIKKDQWNTTSANADLYLATSITDTDDQIRVSIADKTLYDSVVEGSCLSISCKYIDARFDLLNDAEIELAEYATRVITQITLDTGDGNVDTLLAEIETAITPPSLEEFKISSIESLWLEGIPSSAIKAKEFIKNMKPGTQVSLMGINETYEDIEVDGVLIEGWKQIEEFYDLLDRHKGIDKDGSGREWDKPQVTGRININTIPYTEYIELLARYPEVIINAKQIICTVKFYNENETCGTVNVALKTALDEANKLVILGKKVFAPLNPEKAPTQSHYYTFDKWQIRPAVYDPDTGWGYQSYENESEIPTWTEDVLITGSARIDAKFEPHLQQYSVTFDTDSDQIFIDDAHQNLVVEYGSLITKPVTNEIEGVTLVGWFHSDGSKWDFDTMPIVGHTVLKARWEDGNKPVISLARQSYNTFSYEAHDNLGIVNWAVIKDSDQAPKPEDWTAIKSTTNFIGTYTIESAGTYYFWISDANGNTASESIIAYPINLTMVIEDPINAVVAAESFNYYFIEGENTFTSNFAISNSELELTVLLTPHYQDLRINDSAINTLNLAITQPIDITLTCNPKIYTVTFDLDGRGDAAKVPPQEVMFLHTASAPVDQYYFETNESTIGWTITPDIPDPDAWDFENTPITGDLTLYAIWQAVTEPTRITLRLPREQFGDQISESAGITVKLNYSQHGGVPVKVNWGDPDYQTLDTSDEYLDVTSLNHVYKKAAIEKEYVVIEIYGPSGNNAKNCTYSLGGGNIHYPIVSPAEYITNVEFAWDLIGAVSGRIDARENTLKDGALARSNIRTLNLTPYMESIAASCFAGCQNLTQISIPKNIVEIKNEAFGGCNGITTLTLPSHLTKVENYAFQNCKALKTVNIQLNNNICSVGRSLFGGCDGLQEITFGENFNTISTAMFEKCAGLTNIELPSTIQTIESAAFQECSALKRIVTSAKYIGLKAFQSCGVLEKVILTNNQLNLDTAEPGDYIFDKCPKLNSAGPIGFDTDIEFAWTTAIPSYIFRRGYYDGVQDAFASRTENSLNEVILPLGLETIGSFAFGNGYFKTITLPETLTTIGDFAFDGCALQTLTIPQNVTSIGARAFTTCNFLVKATIKALSSSPTVDVVSNAWFFSCPKELQLYIPASVNTSIENVWTAYGRYWNARNSTATFDWSSIPDEV